MTGKELLAKRVAKGLSQAAVSVESGVPLSYLTLLENDERLEEYRRLVDVAVEKLAPGTTKKRYPKLQAIAA